MPDKDRAVAITIDKSLIQEETEEEIKTRVPGTFSDNIRFLWIKKDNCEEINNAKTILTSLNENSTYMLYDRFGNIAENIRLLRQQSLLRLSRLLNRLFLKLFLLY